MKSYLAHNQGLVSGTATINCCNEAKTVFILYTLKPFDIKKILNYKTHKLKWNLHGDFLISKLGKLIYLLRQLFNSVSAETLTTAYFALFQSQLIYGISYYNMGSLVSLSPYIFVRALLQDWLQTGFS